MCERQKVGVSRSCRPRRRPGSCLILDEGLQSSGRLVPLSGNRAPRRSCVTPASAAVGKAITTIEGLSPDGRHSVQRAWAELDVVQCGYCQSGQIMSAAALLAARPDPSDADIDAAMTGNICRCGTYQRIRAAVHRAAVLAKGGVL